MREPKMNDAVMVSIAVVLAILIILSMVTA